MVDPIGNEFVAEIAARYQIPASALLFRYLARKTKAANRGAKARRSLGNLYALLVLAQDVIAGRKQGSRFTDLLSRMKELPFGAKLQNHPLDNRLNDEFGRTMTVFGAMLPVQDTVIDGQKARRLSPELLKHKGGDEQATARFIVDTIQEYIELLTKKQFSYLDDVENIATAEDLAEFLEGAFDKSSDARLFEIVAFILLAEHFRGRTAWVGESKEKVRAEPLRLFRTGRTNANDGGIDFVLQPIGRFFQVTETLDFSKYFLDFEKVNRFPLSFVVKVEAEAPDALGSIKVFAEKSKRYTEGQIAAYMSLFEEIFTLPSLRRLLAEIPDDEKAIERMKAELSLQFKLEYGLLD